MRSTSETAAGPSSFRRGRRPLEDVLADQRRLEALLPPTLWAITGAELRARARRLLAARAAVERRRAVTGERPPFDATLDRAARAAHIDALDALAAVDRAAAASHRLLALGNLTGAAMIGACIAAVSAGVSPLASPVAIGIMASAGGPIGAVIGGWRTRAAARRHHAAAVSAWCDRLAKADAETMGDLDAARLRHEAWQSRCRELETAVEAEAAARAAWREVAGDDVDPASIGALCAAIRQLRSVKIELVEHAIAGVLASRAPATRSELAQRAAAPEVGAVPAPAVAFDRSRNARSSGRRSPGRRASPNHPALAGVALRALPPTPAADPAAVPERPVGPDGDAVGVSRGGDDAGSLVLDLLESIKGKGLRLWSG